MSKFNVGDKVRVKHVGSKTRSSNGCRFAPEMSEYIGTVFTLQGYDYPYWIYEGWRWDEEWLEPIEEESIVTTKTKNMIKTISNTLKRVLTPSMQSQYKAGFRNGDLALTEEGKNELLEILAVKHEDELTKVAEEIIKAEENK